MTTTDQPPEFKSRLPQAHGGNSRSIRLIQVFSWVVTAIFLVALVAAIYQAVVNGNSLPLWAWLGILVLLAIAVGLIVAAVVYRGVAKEVGSASATTSDSVLGELRNESTRVEAGGATTLHVDLNMQSGVLRLTHGAAGIAEADFTYDDGAWLPPVADYVVDDNHQGRWTVSQKAGRQTYMHPGRCEWTIRLNGDVPTELNVQFGAGQAELALAGLNLPFVELQSGIGELLLDLRGEWQHSSEMLIKAGIGDITLRLPESTGVRVRSAVGLGSTQVHGLTRDGDAYTNDHFGQTAVSLDIVLQGGVGKISVEAT